MSAKTLIEEANALRGKVREPAANVAAVVPDSPPAVRKGEDTMSSRPFRLMNVLGLIGGQLSKDDAAVEYDLMNRYRKSLDEAQETVQGANHRTWMYPLSRKFLTDRVAEMPVTRELMSAAQVGMGSGNIDLDEMAWLHGKINKSYEPSVQKTAMSYLTDTTGGALVAPPEFGELIPLMRNQSALDRAGARQVPLPPMGKWIAPRVTGPTTGYWIGENTAITESNPTTGQVSMQAKKLAVTVRVPNELFKYASAAADALLREDTAKTLALGFDYAGLYGTGSGNQPKGLNRYTGTNELIDYAAGTSPAPKGVATDGNILMPQDGFYMAGQIEDRNFDLERGFKWVMRPRLWATIAGFRADAVSANDNAGPFAQAITRLLGDSVGSNWCGHEVVRSSQVDATGTKGSGTGLTQCWGGMWNELLMGMYGSVEFATAMGETAFQSDQTLVRAILHCDSTPRYPGAFIYYKLLLRY